MLPTKVDVVDTRIHEEKVLVAAFQHLGNEAMEPPAIFLSGEILRVCVTLTFSKV